MQAHKSSHCPFPIIQLLEAEQFASLLLIPQLEVILNFAATMAEEIERYRAKVNFHYKFEDVMKQLGKSQYSDIWSPTFFARNIPFKLHLSGEANAIFLRLISK